METWKLEVRRAPDGYRGDLDCIEIVTDNNVQVVPRLSQEQTWDGHEEETVVWNGRPVAILKTWYGDGGRSYRVAAQEIEPLPGTEIVWMD
ncbi:MAG: hypothetical protein H5U02_00180 [Clostridia bacterium]|nr:hypothetical protein [Clostridia bacterium]